MDCLAKGCIQVIIHPFWLESLQAAHPVVLSVFKEPPGFRFGHISVIDLLYKGEPGMLVEVMPGQCEVFIKWATIAAMDIMPMGIYPQIGWGLTFPYIL